MKKKFLVILMGVLMLLTAAGCSCAPASSLDFSSAWNNEPSPPYSETLTYKGTYSASYTDQGFSYVKSENLTDDVCKIDESSYTGATYTVTTQIIPESYYSEAASEILENYDGALIKVTTDFTVNVNLLLNGSETKTATDTQHTEVYLCASTYSFAPVYSKSNSSSTLLIVNNKGASTSTIVNTTEFVYNESKYTSKITSTRDGIVEVDSEKTYNYTKGSIIDNSALMFVLRNLELKVDSSRSFKLPALSFKGSLKDAGVKSLAEKEIELPLGAGGEKETVKTNCYQIGFSGEQAGASKLCYYQTTEVKKEDTQILPDRNYLIRFVEILPIYSSYGLQGSLVFELSSIA